jgi:integrase
LARLTGSSVVLGRLRDDQRVTCRVAGIDPDRLDGRGIGIQSLRKTAINDAIRNGVSMHEVREFAGHADIRTTEVYFLRSAQRKRVC